MPESPEYPLNPEYPEDPISCFLTSGNSYFGDLTGVFTAPSGATYQPEHRYSGGLDFGQTNDFTALSIKDITANCEVALHRWRLLPWAEIRKRIADAGLMSGYADGLFHPNVVLSATQAAKVATNLKTVKPLTRLETLLRVGRYLRGL